MTHMTFLHETKTIRMWRAGEIPPKGIYLGRIALDICCADVVCPKMPGLSPVRVHIRDNNTWESISTAVGSLDRVLSNPLGPALIKIFPNGNIEKAYWLGGLPFPNLDGVVFVPKEQRKIYATLGIELWRGYTYPTSLNTAAMMRAGEIINGGTDKCRS